MTPNEILAECLREAGEDVEAGLLAAEYILSTDSQGHEHAGKGEGGGQFISKSEDKSSNKKETEKEPTIISLDAYFAHDIHNRQAQGILNSSLEAARGLRTDAQAGLVSVLKKGIGGAGSGILSWLDKWRLRFAKLLTTTQVASALEGAREVAAKVPQLDTDKDARTKLIGDIPQPTFPVQDDIHKPVISEAAKQLASKNVLSRHGFDALDAQAKAKAFTVAGISSTETLAKIRDVMAKNVNEGADYETFKSEVLDAVGEGTFLSEGHLETLFRTNVQSAFSDGQMTVLQHPLVKSGFPYAAYDAIHDDRVRENHLALEKLGIGKSNIYRADDPVFKTFRPPWDYNDRCSWTPLTVKAAAERGIAEAQEWERTGIEPSPPAFVPMPAFQPPAGFQHAVASTPLSIQLSMQGMATFSNTEEETDTSLLYGSPEVGSIAGSTGDTATTKIDRKPNKGIKVKRGRALVKRKRNKRTWS